MPTKDTLLATLPEILPTNHPTTQLAAPRPPPTKSTADGWKWIMHAPTMMDGWMYRSRPTTPLPSQFQNVVAGAGAGILTAVITCPLDVLKTRLQNQQQPPPSTVTPSNNAVRGAYKGVAQSLRRIWVEEGVRGLYKGLGPTLLGYLPTWTVYFGTYDQLKRQVSRITGKPSDHSLVHLGGAVGAGSMSTLITNPLWVIKTRMMTQGPGSIYYYQNTWHAMRSIRSTEGWRGFYKGLGPSLVGISHVAVQFPIYERLKRTTFLQARHPTDPPSASLATLAFASTTSKLIASTATYPHEVIRTRLQNETTPPTKYHSLVGTFRTIVKEETWRGLYKGLGTNLIRTVPASAVTLISYEALLRILASSSTLAVAQTSPSSLAVATTAAAPLQTTKR